MWGPVKWGVSSHSVESEWGKRLTQDLLPPACRLGGSASGNDHHPEGPRVCTWTPGSIAPSLAAHAPTPCGHVAGGPFSPCKATLTPTWLALWPDTSPPPGCSNSNDSAAGYVGSVFRHGTASTRHAGRRHGHQQLGEQKRMGRTTVSLPSWPSKAGPLLRCVESRQLPGTLGGKPSPQPCPQSNTTTQKQLGRNS